jgi:hypothetical protein
MKSNFLWNSLKKFRRAPLSTRKKPPQCQKLICLKSRSPNWNKLKTFISNTWRNLQNPLFQRKKSQRVATTTVLACPPLNLSLASQKIMLWARCSLEKASKPRTHIMIIQKERSPGGLQAIIKLKILKIKRPVEILKALIHLIKCPTKCMKALIQ